MTYAQPPQALLRFKPIPASNAGATWRCVLTLLFVAPCLGFRFLRPLWKQVKGRRRFTIADGVLRRLRHFRPTRRPRSLIAGEGEPHVRGSPSHDPRVMSPGTGTEDRRKTGRSIRSPA